MRDSGKLFPQIRTEIWRESREKSVISKNINVTANSYTDWLYVIFFYTNIIFKNIVY